MAVIRGEGECGITAGCVGSAVFHYGPGVGEAVPAWVGDLGREVDFRAFRAACLGSDDFYGRCYVVDRDLLAAGRRVGRNSRNTRRASLESICPRLRNTLD